LINLLIYQLINLIYVMQTNILPFNPSYRVIIAARIILGFFGKNPQPLHTTLQSLRIIALLPVNNGAVQFHLIGYKQKHECEKEFYKALMDSLEIKDALYKSETKLGNFNAFLSYLRYINPEFQLKLAQVIRNITYERSLQLNNTSS
jgi:hypothetical protein